MKCRLKNCLHDDKEIPSGEEVKDGKFYYHADCLQTKKDIQEIASLFEKHINKNVVWAQLYSVINNIVFTKKISSEFLLFGLRYYIENKIPLNYPQGLYYVIQNKEVVNEWEKEKSKILKQKMKEHIGSSECEYDYENRNFNYSSKPKTITDVLGG